MSYKYNPFTGNLDDTGNQLTETTADAIYLRLDCANDPLISDLDITGAMTATGTVTGAAITDNIAILSSGSLASAINGTFSGTVQAEQITSTDDINATDTITGGTITDGSAKINSGDITLLVGKKLIFDGV